MRRPGVPTLHGTKAENPISEIITNDCGLLRKHTSTIRNLCIDYFFKTLTLKTGSDKIIS